MRFLRSPGLCEMCDERVGRFEKAEEMNSTDEDGAPRRILIHAVCWENRPPPVKAVLSLIDKGRLD